MDSRALTFENFPQVARILKHLERKGFEDDEEGDAGPGVCVCVCVCVPAQKFSETPSSLTFYRQYTRALSMCYLRIT